MNYKAPRSVSRIYILVPINTHCTCHIKGVFGCEKKVRREK